MSDLPSGFVADPVTPDGFTPEGPKSEKAGNTSSALATALAAQTVPLIQSMAEHIFTSPTLPKTAGKIGRWFATAASPVAGAASGGLPGALAGAAAASKAGWVGGKTGYFTGKMIQDLAGPLTKIENVLPYMNAATMAQGVGHASR